jgi:hypothetical protein
MDEELEQRLQKAELVGVGFDVLLQRAPRMQWSGKLQ